MVRAEVRDASTDGSEYWLDTGSDSATQIEENVSDDELVTLEKTFRHITGGRYPYPTNAVTNSQKMALLLLGLGLTRSVQSDSPDETSEDRNQAFLDRYSRHNLSTRASDTVLSDDSDQE